MRYDVLKPVKELVKHLQEDYKEAQTVFTEGASNLPILNKPPHPTEILAKIGPLSNQTDGLQKTFSMPSVHIYQFPLHNTTLYEARRTFSNSAHPDFSDFVAGLHIFATAQTGLFPTNSSEYWLALSVFRPQDTPYHLLENGQMDRVSPKQLIEYYAKMDKWQQFHPDALPSNIPQRINSALRRASLF